MPLYADINMPLQADITLTVSPCSYTFKDITALASEKTPNFCQDIELVFSAQSTANVISGWHCQGRTCIKYSSNICISYSSIIWMFMLIFICSNHTKLEFSWIGVCQKNTSFGLIFSMPLDWALKIKYLLNQIKTCQICQSVNLSIYLYLSPWDGSLRLAGR